MVERCSVSSPLVVLAVDLDTVRNWALGGVVAAVVLAVVAALVIKAIVTKLVVVAVLVLVGFLLWSNRSDLADCATRVEQQVTTGGPATSCSFLGFHVDVG
jgi:uncharacterized membrane protein YfcA